MTEKTETTTGNGPRVTIEDLKSKVVDTMYYVFDSTCLTVCVLTLENGFVVTGESSCASPENFNKALGEEISYNNAVARIWPLEGYLLKERLYQQSLVEGK